MLQLLLVTYFNTVCINNNLIISHHHLTGGVDYEHEDDYITVIFRHGMSTSDPFHIVMKNNDDFEVDETFNITIDPLSLPYNTMLGSNANIEITIMDDERMLLCTLYLYTPTP